MRAPFVSYVQKVVYMGWVQLSFLVRVKRHGTACAIGPKGKVRTLGSRAPSVPKAKLGHTEPCATSVPKAKKMKIYEVVVAVAEGTSYIYIVNTLIQKLGSEFYCHPTLHRGLGGSHALCHVLSCTLMVLSCDCHDTIVLGITDSFITSTRHHYSSFFLFYMFLCMFVHPLIYIIK